MKKLINQNEEVKNTYIWDEDEEIEEYVRAELAQPVQKQYVIGVEIDKKISSNVDLDGNGTLETEYFYIQDQLGNVKAIVNNQGRKLKESKYSYYGDVKFFAPYNSSLQIEQIRILPSGNLSILFNEPIISDTINLDNLKILNSNNKK